MIEPSERTGWRGFFDRGGWWKALLVAAGYVAAFQGCSLLIGRLFGGLVDPDNLFASPVSVFIALGLPVIIGSALLLLLMVVLRWSRDLFGPQPLGGRPWMWVAPAVVLLAVILRAAGTDYAAFAPGTVLVTYLAGLFIGLSEELLTRGFAVNLLRRKGYGERTVMLLSSLIFALLHSTNLFTGQPPLTVLLTMVFTFFFGVAMYLTLRVTGSLVWPVLLHGLTDPSSFLATGGIDTAAGAASPLVSVAGLSVWAYVILAILALFLVRERRDQA
ncbi:CPBP family intramembrane glutamic endopeptidase [Microlunatus sp. GCM10028923]|uniref:CPBP family intramembrane glutamic endopeptidase n=1 Tax=Microlunatus sp. GCM10028923 TaxID=3273400 RepID=UPI0036125954